MTDDLTAPRERRERRLKFVDILRRRSEGELSVEECDALVMDLMGTTWAANGVLDNVDEDMRPDWYVASAEGGSGVITAGWPGRAPHGLTF